MPLSSVELAIEVLSAFSYLRVKPSFFGSGRGHSYSRERLGRLASASASLPGLSRRAGAVAEQLGSPALEEDCSYVHVLPSIRVILAYNQGLVPGPFVPGLGRGLDHIGEG